MDNKVINEENQSLPKTPPSESFPKAETQRIARSICLEENIDNIETVNRERPVVAWKMITEGLRPHLV